MSANRENMDTDRRAADGEAGGEPRGGGAAEQAGADQVTGERLAPPSASDLGPDPGSGDFTPDRGEVF
ncbi:MAG: hypothetical protein V7641_896 [Blastocatellia bacterium]